MTRKSKARYGLKRTYKLNPTVKALRNALMAGMLVASVAPNVALAAPPSFDVPVNYQGFPGQYVYNYGDVDASAQNIAAAIVAISGGYDSSVYNTGNLTVIADAGAYGEYADYALAAGIYTAAANGDSEVSNYGGIDVTAVAVNYGAAQAYGIAVGSNYSSVAGDGLVYSYGDINISAVSQDASASAIGIDIYVGDYAYVNNTGDITLSAYAEGSNGPGSIATAIGINAVGNDIAIYNYGDITATADNNNYLGASVAIGINAEAYADITIYNSGDISLSGSSSDGYYFGGYYPNYIYITGDFVASGIKAESTLGSITIENTGNISIVDLNDGGIAGGFRTGDAFNGISAKTLLGDSSITNSGDITITGGEEAFGIVASTDQLTEFYACPPPYDNGYYVCYNRTGGGDATVVNSGDITLSLGVEQEYAFNYGVGISASTGKYGGNATITNSGDITITNSANGDAVGIRASSSGKYAVGSSVVNNTGDITVTSPYNAAGIWVTSTNDSSIYNSGDITIASEEGRARGLYSVTDQVSMISNSGDISVIGGIGVAGIGSAGAYGATAINSGDVSVTSTRYELLTNYYGEEYYAGGWAYGVFASTRFLGVATVINSGDIEVNGITRATGLSANSRFGSTYVYNSGDLTITGELENAYGINTSGSGFEEFNYGETGYTNVINLGDITATSDAFAVGIQARQTYGNILIYNSADVSAIVDNDDYGSAFGLVGLNVYGNVNIINVGDVTVAAGGNTGGIIADSIGYYGYYYSFPADITILNEGSISVTSGYGRAAGIGATTNEGNVELIVSGSVDVAGYDRTTGLSASSGYGDVFVYNEASITVSSSNEYARGIYASTVYGNIEIINESDVDVSGALLTQGISAKSYYGEIVIVNNGDITANSSSGYSNAIAVNSGYSGALVVNNGSLQATGSNAWTINAVGGDLTLLNYGSIFGSMITDSGDDYIYNAEGASIYMDDSSILLGNGYNSFMNNGELIVNGSNNLIDMGTNYSESGVNTFYNYGNSIHMDDGATDDVLTIIGNFAGTGSIFVDVDGLSLTSDRLYIDGDVDSGTENIVDVNLLSLPNASDIEDGISIPIVTVSGVNAPGNFVLGNVQVNNNALFTADYALIRETPATDFSLVFEVTGLTTAGVLLSTVSPAAQNLWFSSLGTMYMRQGAERSFEAAGQADVEGAAGTWLRLYGNDGSMSPDAKRSNFGDLGSQDFALNSSGIEAGFGYSFNSAWTVGVFGGINQGDYKPNVGGKVSLDGNTWGGYVTFTPGNGFYADLSYRDIGFDGDTLSNGNKERLDGSASGFSLEMGYGFKMQSGLEIEPQLQYSAVSVDLDNVDYTSGDFKLTDGDAAQLRIGTAFRKAFNQDSGVWVPYGALSYIQNYDGTNNYLIGGVLEGQVDTSGGSMLLELGTDARYGNFDFNVGVGWQDGGAYNSVLNGQLNVRYSW